MKNLKFWAHFDFLANLYFWLGIIQVLVGIFAGYGSYMLFQSSDPLLLRILGCIILAVSSLEIIFCEGIPHISDSIRSNYRLLQQIKLDELYKESEDET